LLLFTGTSPFAELTVTQTFISVSIDLCPLTQTGSYGEEKRNHPRFPLAVEVGFARVPLLESSEVPPSCSGTTENVGRGGMALLSNQPLPLDSVVRCEIAIPGSSVSIPTLMKVRWSEKMEGKTHYKLGLQFLV
jgi:PilZ domain